MNIDYPPRALKALEGAPNEVRKAFFKQVIFLVDNLHHPSLHAKKYDESKDRWQARINKNWRSISTSPAIPISSATPCRIPRGDKHQAATRRFRTWPVRIGTSGERRPFYIAAQARRNEGLLYCSHVNHACLCLGIGVSLVGGAH